jgi:hypothetical protein
MGHVLRVSVGGLLAVTVPLILLGLSALGGLSFPNALSWAIGAYVATLAVIGYLAVRNVPLQWWARILVLSALVVLGGVVIALQLLAHA